MAIPFLNNIELNQNQVLNLRLQQLATAPTGVSGQVYYNTATNRIGWHDGTAWQDIYPSASANTVNTDVRRDASGNFSAGTITANLTGIASQAALLQDSQNFSITGKATAATVAFNGSGAVQLSVTALTVAPGDITLANGSFIVGNGSAVGAATAKSAIPLSGFGAAGADVAMGGFKITGLADPSNAQDAATKAYVDSLAAGLDPKDSCRLATYSALAATYTTGNQRLTGTSNGALIVDGFFGVVGNRILVKSQSTASQNGVYVVTQIGDGYTPFILTRASDFNTSAKASPGSFVFIEEGVSWADTGWVMSSDSVITLDTSSINWMQFSGAGSYTAGRGLAQAGSVFHFAQTTAYTVGDIFYASNASSIAPLAAAAANNALISNGAAAAPSWGKIGLSTHVNGTLPVANGGTGAATLTANGVLIGNGTSAFSSITATAGQLLLGNASNIPTWTTLTGDVTIGGTGVTAIGANKVLNTMIRQGVATSLIGRSANSTGDVADIAATADKQVLRRAGGVLGFGALMFSGDVGATTATSFTVTHNLGTRDCSVSVYQVASPYAQVFTDVEMATANTVTVRFAASTNGANYRIVVIGF